MNQLFTENAKEYDAFIFFTTLGTDFFFKREVINNILLYNFVQFGQQYHNILELGSGTGLLTLEMALLFPQTLITALESSEYYNKIAQQKCGELGCKNIKFITGNAAHPQTYVRKNYKADIIVGTMFPKYLNDCFDDTCAFTRNLRQLSHPNTLIILQDISVPDFPLFKSVYQSHINFVVEFAKQNPKWQSLAQELPQYANNNWKNQLPKALERAGFETWSLKQPFGISTIIFARPK